MALGAAGVLGLLLAAPARGFYLPGVAPRALPRGAELRPKVNSLISEKTNLPYDYFHLPFCEAPPGVDAGVRETLGEWMMGGRIRQSAYAFAMKEDLHFAEVCTLRPPDQARAENWAAKLAARIEQDYRVLMILDNLPVTVFDLNGAYNMIQDLPTGRLGRMTRGYNIGFSVDVGGDSGPRGDGHHYFLHNHLIFNVLVHEATDDVTVQSTYQVMQASGAAAGILEAAQEAAAEETWFVVGFEVMPCSINPAVLAEKGPDFDWFSYCHENDPQNLMQQYSQDVNKVWEKIQETAFEVNQGAFQESGVPFSYSVIFTDSEIPWTHRWDAYLLTGGGQIHVFSTINSLVVAMLLTFVVAAILLRTIRNDISQYEAMLADEEGALEDLTGWKLVSGDVFRAPAFAANLAVSVGTGMHLAATLALITTLAGFGLISPAVRGGLLTSSLLVYYMCSYVGGYSGVRHLRVMRGTDAGWRGVALRIAWTIPGSMFGLLTLLNAVIWHTGSIGGVPAWVLAVLFVLWTVLATPLCFLGAMHARRGEVAKDPTTTNKIPRVVPPSQCGLLTSPLAVAFLGGILPFGVMYIEVHYIFASMFQYHVYFAFGFLFAVSLIALLVTVEVSIIYTYFKLCMEDYHWWWQSFASGFSVALYLFIYGIIYLVTDLGGLTGGSSVFLYLTYLTCITLILGYTMGTIAFVGSHTFVRKIYGSVKAD